MIRDFGLSEGVPVASVLPLLNRMDVMMLKVSDDRCSWQVSGAGRKLSIAN